jgi:hypothetical protein
MEFAISYDRLGRSVMAPMLLGPGRTTLQLDDHELRVHMGWGFDATVPRAQITGAAMRPRGTANRGVHGWRGRWMVNGAGKGLVTITIDPPVRARMMGLPITLRELIISVDSPTALITALT